MREIVIGVVIWLGYAALVNGCQDSDLPMWSWGFAQRCCQVYPSYISSCIDNKYECGDLSDSNYFPKLKNAEIQKGGDIVVYSASANLPDFIQIFNNLPKSNNVVLVSGLEDVGVPFEVVGFGRKEFDGAIFRSDHALYQNISRLLEFIQDPRLKRWYTQNYDVVFDGDNRPSVGCRKGSPGCHDGTRARLTDSYEKAISFMSQWGAGREKEKSSILGKVYPLPIGVDFHSSLNKRKREGLRDSRGICRQQNDILNTRSRMPPFSNRPLRLSAEFSCEFDRPDDKAPTPFAPRVRICDLLEKHKHKDISRKSSGGNRGNFWGSMAQHAFSLSPPGHGQDTHRFWEILLLGSVPIVVSSPLDRLVCQFPSVILKDWSVLFSHDPRFEPRGEAPSGVSSGGSGSKRSQDNHNATAIASNTSPTTTRRLVDANGDWLQNALRSLKEIVQQRYGPEPFAGNSSVYHRLTSAYWKDVVTGKTEYLKCPKDYVIKSL